MIVATAASQNCCLPVTRMLFYLWQRSFLGACYFVQLSFRRPKAFDQTVELPKDTLCSFEPETVKLCRPLCSALPRSFNWTSVVLLQKFWFFEFTWTKKKKEPRKKKFSLTTKDCWKVFQAVNFFAKRLTNYPTLFLISWIFYFGLDVL